MPTNTGLWMSFNLDRLVEKKFFLSICVSQKPGILYVSSLVGLAMVFYSFFWWANQFFYWLACNFSVWHLKFFKHLPFSDPRPQLHMEFPITFPVPGNTKPSQVLSRTLTGGCLVPECTALGSGRTELSQVFLWALANHNSVDYTFLSWPHSPKAREGKQELVMP